MQILTLCGSLRKASLNRHLLNAAQKVAPASMVFVDADISKIPAFNQDVESAGEPASVVQFRAALSGVDGILIASPEYNYSVPGFLKNAIDWISRPPSTSPLRGKPVGIMGASMGVGGTIRMQSHIRQTFQFLNMPAMMQPEVAVPTAHTKFDADGKLTDEMTLKFVTAYMAAFEAWVEKHSG